MSVQTAHSTLIGRRDVARSRPAAMTASRRRTVAVAAGAAGLALVAVSAAMPWLTIFHGTTPLRGFRLDGGDLSGLALTCALLLVVAGRRGGGRVLRPVAGLLALAVAAGALHSWRSIAAYVTDPGPAAALTAPTGGPGPLVMSAGGLLLFGAAIAAPLSRRPMAAADRLPLGLAALLFAAGWMHLVLTPEHFGESAVLGAGFLTAALVQLVLAGLALERPSDGVWSAAVILNTALVVIWMYAVLHGLPFGGDEHGAEGTGLRIGVGEPVDLAAVVTKLAEIVAIGLAVLLMRRLKARTD